MNTDRFSDSKRYLLPLMTDEASWNSMCDKEIISLVARGARVSPFPGPNLDYIGVEIEVERPPRSILTSLFWKSVPEGSLRNGAEFKTYPLRPIYLPYAMDYMDGYMKTGKPDFSERTSVHVHVDFRHQTLLDLVKLMMVYLAFERYLYLYAGPDRFKSNFCVPMSLMNVGLLSEVHQAVEGNKLNFHFLMDNLMGMMPGKYSGFNIKSLNVPQNDGVHESSGTIEFRHMSGTADPSRIVEWVSILLRMKSYAIENDYHTIKNEINALNTTSEYHKFAEAVFGELSNVVVPPTVNWTLLAENLRLIKEAMTEKLVVPASEFLRSPIAAKLQSVYEKPKKKEATKFRVNPLVDVPVLMGDPVQPDAINPLDGAPDHLREIIRQQARIPRPARGNR
jgi:hypothetical protein